MISIRKMILVNTQIVIQIFNFVIEFVGLEPFFTDLCKPIEIESFKSSKTPKKFGLTKYGLLLICV